MTAKLLLIFDAMADKISSDFFPIVNIYEFDTILLTSLCFEFISYLLFLKILLTTKEIHRFKMLFPLIFYCSL